MSVDGRDRSVTLCGVNITASHANAFGGALFRVAYSFTEPTDIDRTVIDGANIDDGDPSQGGTHAQKVAAGRKGGKATAAKH